MKLGEFMDALQEFEAAQSIDGIATLCRHHCTELGFDHFIYAMRVPTQFSESRLVLIDGYPPDWVAHYFEQAFQAVDPVMGYCNRHIVPVEWHKLAMVPGEASQRMMQEAGDFGLKGGISMPIHSPHGELGVLSFATSMPANDAHDATRYAAAYVQIMAGYVHEAVRRVAELGDSANSQAMTAREQECLRWVADGKTSWEIAALLNVSERTVNFHLNNVMQKLGVCSRQHAVGKAAFQGLIRPNPF